MQPVESREEINSLLDQDQHINLVIPRGYIKDHPRIPVMGHMDGLCTIYVAQEGVKVVVDAKTDYP